MYPHHLHTPDRPLPATVPAGSPAGKQLVEVILLHEELTHNIEADIRRIEKARKLEESPILADNGSDDYSLCRLIDQAVNHVVARCRAYLLLPSPFVRRISTNHTHNWEEKNILLALPHNWAPHNIDALRDAVHNYIVKNVEYQLLAQTLPQDATTMLCQQQATDSYNEINALINSRLGGVHIKPTIFG